MRRSIGNEVTRMAVAGAVLLALGASVAAAGEGLDGRWFKVEVGEKGKPKAEDDQISFTAGKLHSKACDPYGFGSGAYKATVKDGVTSFEAETTSAKEGKIRWKGTVKGDLVEGLYVWTKAGQADIEYWLKGRIAK